jgi:hypothetical protein
VDLALIGVPLRASQSPSKLKVITTEMPKPSIFIEGMAQQPIRSIKLSVQSNYVALKQLADIYESSARYATIFGREGQMERYVTGKPRFLVVTNGHGYAVMRLDGRLHRSDEHLTLVNKFRSRQQAEQSARQSARGFVVANTKFHIPIATKQERMRRRHSVPESLLSVHGDGPVAQEKHFTPGQVAEMWGRSVWTVRRMLADTPGIARYVVGGRQYMMIPARVLTAYHDKLTEVTR